VAAVALPFVYTLPLSTMRPVLVVQLLLWAFGQFTQNLPSNAIIMARISGKNLSNVSAFTGMLQQMCMLTGYAVLIAVAAASGDQSQRESFDVVWLIMIGMASISLLGASN
jgi:hypothetical protein